ncbi:MAG: helix-turn-helix domain-containing protein [Acidobacteriales bacterium]|nr:helix-turn-helix domain-containing protein [Terriglobales bacterium]
MDSNAQGAMNMARTAKYLNVCKATVYDLIARKELRAKKLGRKTVVRVVDAEEFLRRLPDKTGASELHSAMARRRWAKREAQQ